MSDVPVGIVLLFIFVLVIMSFVCCALSNKFRNDCNFLLSGVCTVAAVLLLIFIPIFIYLV